MNDALLRVDAKTGPVLLVENEIFGAAAAGAQWRGSSAYLVPSFDAALSTSFKEAFTAIF